MSPNGTARLLRDGELAVNLDGKSCSQQFAQRGDDSGYTDTATMGTSPILGCLLNGPHFTTHAADYVS
jgi:hypothetical protein